MLLLKLQLCLLPRRLAMCVRCARLWPATPSATPTRAYCCFRWRTSTRARSSWREASRCGSCLKVNLRPAISVYRPRDSVRFLGIGTQFPEAPIPSRGFYSQHLRVEGSGSTPSELCSFQQSKSTTCGENTTAACACGRACSSPHVHAGAAVLNP